MFFKLLKIITTRIRSEVYQKSFFSMRLLILTFLLLNLSWVSAQTGRDLIAYYSFDDCTANDNSGGGSNGIATPAGGIACDCGVRGQALLLDGVNTQVQFFGSINNNFAKKDFTISLYIKPLSISSSQEILFKKEGCNLDNILSIEYSPASNFISGIISENASKSANVGSNLAFGSCWQHIILKREGNRSSLYINGELKQEVTASTRVDLSNNAVLTLGGDLSNVAICPTNRPFNGYVDELRIYDRALDDDELEGLYYAPDRIANRDTTIFLGNAVPIDITNTCANIFSWSPATDVSDATIATPSISPTVTTSYQLSFNDGRCIANDSIRITVIDPATLDCQEIFLPNAFTPNGDNRNDSYGISNPYAISNLISLEIFDRWGGRVFFTDDPFVTWDGSFKGEPVNPGVMLYRVRYNCDGEEKIDVGSLSIIR